MQSLDRAALRAELPLLDGCVYMNSCSMGATPRGVQPVLDAYWEALRTFRDEHFERWWNELWAYADAIAAFIGAPPRTVVIDTNLSTLLGRVLSCFDYAAPRSRIVITDREFPTVEFLCRGFARYGAETIVIGSSDGATVDEDALCEAIDERTRLVCVSLATTATGSLVDVRRIARRAHAFGAAIAVDAYQAVGIVPVDVAELEVDFLLGGAHKWLCGSFESAFLYIDPRVAKELAPATTGWIAGASPFDFGKVQHHADDARRFGSGTPAILPALVSRVGLDLLARVGIATIREASIAHTQRIIERADAMGIRVLSPHEPSRRAGTVSLRFAGDAAVARELVRLGFVCSHRDGLRVAPHVYTTEEEVERFMDTLGALVEEAKRWS